MKNKTLLKKLTDKLQSAPIEKIRRGEFQILNGYGGSGQGYSYAFRDFEVRVFSVLEYGISYCLHLYESKKLVKSFEAQDHDPCFDQLFRLESAIGDRVLKYEEKEEKDRIKSSLKILEISLGR